MQQGVLERAGGLLFRWRSFTPVPLLLVAAPLVWSARRSLTPGWFWTGVALCIAGQAVRAWVLGLVPDGTSGQNEKLIAVSLNTRGPYAWTRNPLYFGNFLITAGVCLATHSIALCAIVLALFALQYRAIIAAEESFLRGRFGSAYEAFCAEVPRFWPRPPRWTRSAAPFDWRRALRKEHNPLAAWIALLVVIDALVPPRGHLLVPLSAVLVGWLAVKGWKHRWLAGNFTADLRRRLRETAR